MKVVVIALTLLVLSGCGKSVIKSIDCGPGGESDSLTIRVQGQVIASVQGLKCVKGN